MTTFTGTANPDTANAVTSSLIGFTPNNDVTLLTDLVADTFFGLGGNDIITAGGTNDQLFGGAGADTLNGAGGSDVYGFLNGDVAAGEIINDTGSSGDTDVLGVGGSSVDFGAAATITGIEGLVFATQAGTQKGIFNASQLPTNLIVIGNTLGADKIDIHNALSFSAAGWGFNLWDSIDTITITGTTANNSITGSSQAEAIAGLAGNDTLKGGAGNDVLTGGLGKDTQTGGLGADTFDFNLKTESKIGASHRDQIIDFNHLQHDKIDLSGIDANTHKGGNQAFHFIGAHAFHSTSKHHVFGELRYANHVLSGDANGDGHADFEVHVNAAHLVVGAGGDFNL